MNVGYQIRGNHEKKKGLNQQRCKKAYSNYEATRVGSNLVVHCWSSLGLGADKA